MERLRFYTLEDKSWKGTSFNFINSLIGNAYPLLKKVAFNLEAETAHNLAIQSMNFFGKVIAENATSINHSELNLKALGISFSNPFGLAAGLDKNAEALSYLTALPFGFVEVGTVTPRPQAGNEKPRLWRLVEEESLRNRMGFNNHGAEILYENILKANKRNKILGINLGKNKITPNELAHEDYKILYQKFSPLADYLVINVSSPNTPGLRDLLQDKGLRTIFESLVEERKKCKKPLLVKISPDMSSEELLSVVGLCNEFSLEGIIATNTTIVPNLGEGGISGKLLAKKAKETRHLLLNELRKTNSTCELIGVGGISSFQDLVDFWSAGGKLVQVYSSFIFQGPKLLHDLEAQTLSDMNKKGVKTFDEYLHALARV